MGCRHMRFWVAIFWLSVANLAAAQESRLLEPIAPVRHAADRDGDGQLPPRAARLRWRPEAKSEIKAAAHEVAQTTRDTGSVVAARADEFVTEARRRGNEKLEEYGDDIESDLLDAKDEALREVRRRRAGFDSESGGGGFGSRLSRLFDGGGLFTSDCEFQSFVSPVTNPFLFEDPRTLTEIRGIGLFQKVPNGQPNFQGGSLWFVGGRGSIAFTKRVSLVVSKFGLSGVGTPSRSNLSDGVGLSELWLGPKVTIIRDVEYGTLLAGGVQFQIPIGSGSVYQDTGRLSVVPYVSAGQTFLKTRLGQFSGLANTGYAFSTNRQRSDYFYASGQVAFDVGNKQTFFPLVEVNWFQYTTNGTSRYLATEGRDLVNFGALAKGSSLVTAAVGARYRYSKPISFGGAVELPLLGNRDTFKYRLIFDITYRF
jgi:hypothetical protein